MVVLSVMYILVRIRADFPLDKEEKGFEIFKSNLTKSTNIIFVDQMNTNHLFGCFLSFFKLDLGDIVNCCQYIGHYLNYKMLRLVPLESVTLEEYLSAYHYNP